MEGLKHLALLLNHWSKSKKWREFVENEIWFYIRNLENIVFLFLTSNFITSVIVTSWTLYDRIYQTLHSYIKITETLEFIEKSA